MTSPTRYSWQRRWLNITKDPSSKHPYDMDHTGYIVGTTWLPRLVEQPIGTTLEELSPDLYCAVLLGEPGIGKSYEWNKLRSNLEGNPDHLFINLGTLTSEDVLRREIEESPEFESWSTSKNILTLWLDSLDEGLLHISKLQEGILRVLKKLDLKRLRLRITCRNAIWPVAFTEALQKLWGIGSEHSATHFAILLLSPLTQQQVREAAEQEGFDIEQFLHAISEVNAQPLASSPVTLQILVALFREDQQTFGISETAGRAGLYERGCLALCQLPDQHRDDRYRVDSRGRLLLAGYLAFMAVLTNRRIILTEPVVGGLELNELDPYAVGAGHTVEWNGFRSPITELAIRDLLKNTGLFTDMGYGKMAWSHQSYAEFLAAWYLNLTKLPPASVRPLFRSATDPAGGIVPALQETSAWLAELQPDFWYEILELDPLALIQSDLRLLSENQRAAVVERLILWLSKLSYPPYRDRGFMRYLLHAGLEGQLCAILTNPAPPGATLRFANDLVLACEVRQLQPLLVTQALDTSITFSMRANALDLLVRLADDDAREALRPLLRMPIPFEDVRDEFRGDLLRILWPEFISPDELLPLLTREKDDHYLGSYRVFLDGLEKGGNLAISINSVLNSLRWLTENLPKIKYEYRREKYWGTVNRLVWGRAWQLIDEPDILVAMADLFIVADEQSEYFSVDDASTEARLSLFKHLLFRQKRPHEYSVIFNHHNQSALLSQQDWDQVYSLINTPLSASARKWLTRVLMFLLRQTLELNIKAPYSVRYDQLLEAKMKYLSSRKIFNTWYKAVDLDSEEAIEARDIALKNRKREKKELRKKKWRRKNRLHLLLKGKRRIHDILIKGTTATFREWYLLLHYLCSKKDKTGFSAFNDISQSQEWPKLSAEQRSQVLELACEIVSRYPSPPNEWYSMNNTVSTYGIALYRAILLCYSQCPEYIRRLSLEFWENWACFLVTMDSFWNDRRYNLSVLASTFTPDAIDTAIFLQADANESKKDGSNYYEFGNWYRTLPESKVPEYMLKAIRFGVWREDFSASLLVNMLQEGYQPAWYFVNQLMQEEDQIASHESERPELIVAVYSWILFSRNNFPQEAWGFWERLSNRPELAESLINKCVSRTTHGDLKYLIRLDEEQLHTLVLWLTYAFQLTPEDVDDWDGNNHKKSLATLRSEILFELASRGTTSAWGILKELSAQMGEPSWLRFRIDQVRENLRRNSWEPITPIELLKLSQDGNRRWIKTAEDLQQLIFESLKRFQADLHNELVASEVLWTPIKDPHDNRKILGYQVRDENFLSNVIRRHLMQDLQRSDILVKREVEIRPSFGSGTGQRTDLFVEAFYYDAGGNKADIITVVIEVKLSKHDKTETALNEQLLPYLKDQKYKHGIYLVAWHYGDYDPKPESKISLPDLHRLLQQQVKVVNEVFNIKALLLDIRLPGDKTRCDAEMPLFKEI